jgi:hypothetical protein
MWQWILQGDSEQYFTTSSFYATKDDVAKDFSSTIIRPALWTEIEVDVDSKSYF